MVAFIIGGIVPPYVPKSALADDNAVSSVQFLFVQENFFRISKIGRCKMVMKAFFHMLNYDMAKAVSMKSVDFL